MFALITMIEDMTCSSKCLNNLLLTEMNAMNSPGFNRNCLRSPLKFDASTDRHTHSDSARYVCLKLWNVAYDALRCFDTVFWRPY